MTDSEKTFDAIVLGAGVAGIYQIKRLVDLGLDTIALEADADLGGTWYRNRYPGARFDSESYTYGYSFSKEVLNEWHWKEKFSPQPETLKYLNFVAQKFNLRKYMRFNSRVKKMVWDEDARHWTLELTNGDTYKTRFVITSVGVLSMPTPPRIPGMDDFQGESFHTYYWPEQDVPLAGRKVGVVGTGATGIQVIAEIADKVGELTVFQRRPNWSIPLNNSKISEQEMAGIRARYDEIFAACAVSQGNFEHLPDERPFNSLTKDQRRAFWDELYGKPGFSLLLANFAETFLDPDANKELSDYVADRIRQRVNDPQTAEKLIPTDHGFGRQRLPLETNYFEAYNRDNVHLVDLKETPIERITETGIQTAQSHYDLDVIIYATGFDSITGALSRIDIRGTNGQSLNEKWKEGARTYMGVLTSGFPNLIMVAGPQSVSGSTNYPRAIEEGVNWITAMLEFALDKNTTRIDVEKSAEDAWVEEVVLAHEAMPFSRSKSWFTGYNSNVPGHNAGQIHYNAYWGGGLRYRELLNQATEDRYSAINMN